MTERVLNLVTYIQWEKPQVIEYDKICNGLKALSEILSIYSYIINGIIELPRQGRFGMQKKEPLQLKVFQCCCFFTALLYM